MQKDLDENFIHLAYQLTCHRRQAYQKYICRIYYFAFAWLNHFQNMDSLIFSLLSFINTEEAVMIQLYLFVLTDNRILTSLKKRTLLHYLVERPKFFLFFISVTSSLFVINMPICDLSDKFYHFFALLCSLFLLVWLFSLAS